MHPAAERSTNMNTNAKSTTAEHTMSSVKRASLEHVTYIAEHTMHPASERSKNLYTNAKSTTVNAHNAECERNKPRKGHKDRRAQRAQGDRTQKERVHERKQQYREDTVPNVKGTSLEKVTKIAEHSVHPAAERSKHVYKNAKSTYFVLDST